MGSRITSWASLLPCLMLAACGGGGGGGNPGPADVTVTASGTQVTVTAVGGGPVSAGDTASFTVTADAGYTRNGSVGGTCPAGSFAGNVYTTGTLTADCTVTFSATLNTYTVTPSGDANLSVTPSGAQAVNHGATLAVVVTPVPGFAVSTTVGGTCPPGSFTGSTWTTGVITGNCTVTFTSEPVIRTVTPSGDGNVSLAPSTPQAVAYGSTTSILVTPTPGYTLDAPGGTCPAGSFAGSTWTTGVITADCTVTFTATGTPTLALSGTTLGLRTSGTPRTLTVTNTGTGTAASVGYTATLPSGTTISPASCGDLAPLASCALTVTPGATASAAAGDPNPVPVELAVSGSNTNTVTADLHIVGLGSVYQAGYVFAIDDSTPATGGIGGKVLALQDQAPPFPNGIAWSDSNTVVTGVSETDTVGVGGCNGATDGDCNTAAIVAANSPPVTVPANDPSGYAAGLCTATISGRSDWYLPALCELSYDGNSAGTGCGTAGSPTTANVQGNLVDAGALVLSGAYWSSTQYSAGPATFSWMTFLAGGGSSQTVQQRGQLMGVRCARAVTP